jgi:hypothetical protein
MATDDPPTSKQLRYLRALADRTGTTFASPRTRREASQAIDQLRRRRPEPSEDRRRERRQVSDDLASAGPASSVRADEIAGYGSQAHWRRGGVRPSTR